MLSTSRIVISATMQQPSRRPLNSMLRTPQRKTTIASATA